MPREIRPIPEPWFTAMVQAGVTDPRNAERPSLNQLSDRVGVTVTTLTSMVHGERETDQATIDKVAEVLKVRPRLVSEWAGRIRAVDAEYIPPSEASLMSGDQRKLVDGIIRQFVKAAKANVDASQVNESPTQSPGRVTPIRTREPLQPPARAAAKKRSSKSP